MKMMRRITLSLVLTVAMASVIATPTYLAALHLRPNW